MKQVAAHWSVLITIVKAQEQSITFLQILCSVAHLSVFPGCQFYYLHSPSKLPECFMLCKSALQGVAISSHVEVNSACAGPNEVPSEKGGAGANGYTYFVCNNLGGALSRLHSVKPAHIRAARQVKKFVSGKLDVQARQLQ